MAAFLPVSAVRPHDSATNAPQQTATAEDTRGDGYAATRVADDIEVARVHPRPGESPLPPLERPRCEGY